MKFCVPTKIVFGSGAISQLRDIAEKEMNSKNMLLVTDKGIVKAGIAEKVTSQFKTLQVFDEVEPNPRSTTVNRMGKTARQRKPDLVIGLGGGSAIDAAKAVALLATNDGNIEDYVGREKYRDPPLPVIAIPTTCGTGSEVTWVSVITHVEEKTKISIKGPKMFPAVALVDPDVLVSLPQFLVASTGMDALTHSIEAYTVKPRTYITDMFACESLKLILESIEDAYRNMKNNEKARERIMLGSMLAGMAFGNSDVGAVHCLAETIGGMYDVPHGVANSVFLPHVMEFNMPATEERYSRIARIAGIDEDRNNIASRKLIEKIKDLSRFLNIPSLKSLGIRESDFPVIAQRSVQNNSNPSNAREVDTEGYMEILKMAFGKDV